MDINIHNIIKSAVISSKSRRVFDLQGKLTFKIVNCANKVMIRNAVESLWNVKDDKVAVLNVKGEMRRFSGKAFKTKAYKKAIVTLKKGYKVDVPWQQYETAEIEVAEGEVSVPEAA